MSSKKKPSKKTKKVANSGKFVISYEVHEYGRKWVRVLCNCNRLYNTKKEAADHAAGYARDPGNYRNVQIHQIGAGLDVKSRIITAVGDEEYEQDEA